MSKGSGTRSGLLWEVERILTEIRDSNGELPQILFMENVPQVHSQDNMPDFRKWLDFLESLGYTNYYQDLNAKNYGVAQNRERCFMFSFLGEYNYHFPQPIPLKKKLEDYLEDNVDEKYYINNEKADKLIRQLIDNGTLPQHNLDRQTDRQTDRLALTEQSISRSKEKLQTVSRQDMTAEYQTCGQTETLLLSNQATQIEKQIDIATTLMARDYKGFGNQSMNGVIEWKY
jgi:DNA (cytosine-5)-methyltransferase 1